MSELKKCPFCGGEATISDGGYSGEKFLARCRELSCPAASGFIRKTHDEAVAAWNHRTQPEITGETSDGYHTFNELYNHRAVLFSVICNDHPTLAWKSKQHHDGTMYDGMFIVGIQTPEGQATYHYDVNPYWVMFRVPELPQAPEWDGHTPAQAIERIGKLCAQPENEPLTCVGCEHDGSYENEREYGYPSPCMKCRRIATDNYRRKPERSELDA